MLWVRVPNNQAVFHGKSPAGVLNVVPRQVTVAQSVDKRLQVERREFWHPNQTVKTEFFVATPEKAYINDSFFNLVFFCESI